MLRLALSLATQVRKVKDIIFGNIHTEDSRNLVQEDGGYLLL